MTWLIAGAITCAIVLSLVVDSATGLKGFALAALFSVAVLLLRSRLRKSSSPDVELYDDVMVLPAGEDRAQRRTVQYETLRAAVTRGRRPYDELVLETVGHTYVYPRDAFEDENAFPIFFKQLRNRLERHPRGAQIFAEIEHRENLTRRMFRVRPRVTHGLLALIAGMFLVQGLLGAVPEQGGVIEIVRLGANVSERTFSGEWYRLFTANFLHGGFLHIYLNCLGLLSLGGAIERLVGRWTYLTVFLLSGVGGALTSALFPPMPGATSVGVSTALFGLLGAFAVLHIRYTSVLPAGIRQSGRWWTFVIGVNIALPFVLEVIDIAAHVGGFFVGVFATLVLLRWRRGLTPRSDRKALRPALVLAGLYFVAFSHAVVDAASFNARDRIAVADAVYGPKIHEVLDEFRERPTPLNERRLSYLLQLSLVDRGTAWLGGVDGEVHAVPEGRSVRLEGRLRAAHGATLWLFEIQEREVRALMRVRLGSDVELPTSIALSPSSAKLKDDARIEVALVDGRGCDCDPLHVDLTVWPEES